MATKKIVTQPKTIYICENCGAEHTNENKFHVDYVTGKEICDKCQQMVRLVDRDMYYDKHTKDFGEVYTKEVAVDKKLVKTTELDLDIDREEYLHKVAEARQLFMDLIDKIDTEYLKDNIRDFKVKNFVKMRYEF